MTDHLNRPLDRRHAATLAGKINQRVHFPFLLTAADAQPVDPEDLIGACTVKDLSGLIGLSVVRDWDAMGSGYGNEVWRATLDGVEIDSGLGVAVQDWLMREVVVWVSPDGQVHARSCRRPFVQGIDRRTGKRLHVTIEAVLARVESVLAADLQQAA